MKRSNELVLKAFLSRCAPEKKKALERFLSEKERARLEELPSFPKEVSAKGFSNGNLLEQVHWSWFLPTLKTYPQREQKGFLTALASQAPATAESLGAALELQIPPANELTEAGLSFLREILVNSLVGTEDRLLPVDYLPPSPLNRLLWFSKKDLIRLIDFLSMYDLSAELRQIVETKTLKKIYAILTEDERKVLKIASSQKEVFSLPRMGLEKWDGSEESLKVLLHRRGLSRFGTALSGQNLDFIWYICHHLDIGRGNALFKLYSKEGSPEISEAIIRQIEELLSNTDRLL